MTAARRRVRSGRSVSGAPVVAVTGAAGSIGTAILEALLPAGSASSGPASSLIALDTDRGPVDGPVWKVGRLDVPDVVDRLRGADVVVHVASRTDLAAVTTEPARARRERAVVTAQAVTTASAAVGARHLIVVTSAAVLGARPDNPVPLPDDAPVAATPDDGLLGDLLEVESVLAAARRSHPGLRVTVLRPAALVGPGVDTIVTRHFEAPRLLALRGVPMRWQFCHLDDLGSAVAAVIAGDLGPGPFGVGAEGSLSSAEVERRSGMRRIEVPSAMAFGTAERLHRVGVLPAPANDLSYVVYPWVVSAAGLRAAGWAPSWSNERCLDVLLDGVRGRHAVAGRRLGTRDAAMGAAGAAVAVIGTAALLRRARKK